MATVGNLVVNLGLNARKFGSGLVQSQGMLGKFSSGVTSLIGKLGPLALAGAALVGLGSFGGAIAFGVQAAAQAEQAQVAFTTIIGNADVAKKTLGDLSKFAAETPFETPELTDASRSLLAFGVSADDLIPTLRAVGDISSGIGAPIGDIAELYGKAKVQGRLFAQDINQLTGRGIPIIQQLGKQFGVTDDQVKALVESGQVNFGHLQKAFADMTADGGQFGGMMKAQSGTLSGMWSTLKDNVGLALRDIGQAIIEEFDLKGSIGGLNDFATTFQTNWLPTIRGVIRAAAETWRGVVIFFGEAWESWLGPAVESLTWAVSNFDILWQIALANVSLFASNAGIRFSTFFTNVGEWLTWFTGNWKMVLADIGQLIVRASINYVRQFGEVFKTLIDFAQGKGFKFKQIPLQDGFVSQIKELPKLTQAAIQDTTPELDRLYAELADRDRQARTDAVDALTPAVPEKTLSDLVGDGPGKTAGKAEKQADHAALVKGSAEAIALINGRGRTDPQERTAQAAEKLAQAQADQARTLDKIEENTKTPAVVVRSF